MDPKIFVGGTPRSGTSVLMKILRTLGIATEQEVRFPGDNAIGEGGKALEEWWNRYPRVIKQPFEVRLLAFFWERGQEVGPVEHVFVFVRNPSFVMESTRRRGLVDAYRNFKNSYFTLMEKCPCNLCEKHFYEWLMGSMLLWCNLTQTPHTVVTHPRSVLDVGYLHEKTAPVFGYSLDEFKGAYDKVFSVDGIGAAEPVPEKVW